MKKIIYTLLIATLVFSCDDQLERFPVDNLVEETAYRSVSDLENGLAGALGNLNISNTIGLNSIFTDNAKLGMDNGGQQLNLLNQILNSQTNSGGIWNNRYAFANSINRVLAAAANITPANGEEDTYNNILAQCYAFRAYAHHDVLIYYGFDIMDDSSQGVPYQDTVSSTSEPSRLSTGEVLAKIEADLASAVAFMPASQTDVNFATLDFITFLRARIALYTGDYETAITLSTNIINNYPLADTTQYSAMYNGDTDTTEVIYKYDNVQGFNFNIAGTWIFTGTGGSFIEMSNGLFNVLDPNDVRRSILLDPTSDPSNNIHNIGKYPPGGDTNYINDYKAMRVSEMYLVRAEAHARKTAPNFMAAAADVDAVRAARFTVAPSASSYSNLVDAITGIKLERRIELAFEGHRYLDSKRYKDILNVGIVRDPADCQGGIPCSIPVGSEKFIIPVPQAEINANTNITQAPGY